MADLSKWVHPVNLGPFRLGLQRPGERDYTTWSDAKLIERMRELTPALVESWRAREESDDARQLEYLLEQALKLHPDLVSSLLSDQEAHDLGI